MGWIRIRIHMDPELLPWYGTRKIQSWIRIRNKSFLIRNTASFWVLSPVPLRLQNLEGSEKICRSGAELIALIRIRVYITTFLSKTLVKEDLLFVFKFFTMLVQVFKVFIKAQGLREKTYRYDFFLLLQFFTFTVDRLLIRINLIRIRNTGFHQGLEVQHGITIKLV